VLVHHDVRSTGDELITNVRLSLRGEAVPDHWHSLIAHYAIESGKDVYCEKPLTYAINEGKTLVRSARRYGTVFQTGSVSIDGTHSSCTRLR